MFSSVFGTCNSHSRSGSGYKVEIGNSSGDLIAVHGDLAEGDRMAIRDAENVSQGAEVQIMMSGANITAADESDG
jgi:hypothetical protein